MSTTTSTLANRFDVNVSGLTRHLFLDSIIIALTSLVIGLPAVSTIYNYFSNVLGSYPRVKCYPPSNINASTADIEYFCLSHYSLYATFYPAMATVFGGLITAVFYIWISHHSSMFDLFYSWTKKMDKSDNPQQNLTIIKKINNVIGADNSMYTYYVVMKVFQVIFALIAFLVTLILLCISPFDQSSLFQYDLIFYCQVDQFELLNSSLLSAHDQVPCSAINLRTTIGTLYINLVLLFLVFLCSILSVFPKLFLPVHSHKLFKCDKKAVSFSFHTGLSPHFYQSKEPRVHRVKISENLEFLKVFLLRTNSELANKIWNVEMFDEIKLSIIQETMMSISNYKRVFVDSGVTGPFQLPTDLKGEGIDAEEVLKHPKDTKKYEANKALKLKKPQTFRGAVLKYCSAAAGETSNAVYIAFDPNSLGIPLALSFIFQTVYIVSFDPDCTVEGSTTDTVCRKKEYYDNLQQLIVPHDILASEPSNWATMAESFEAVALEDIDCIVCGPVKNETSRLHSLILMLNSIEKASGCILLTVAPLNTIGEKYIKQQTLKDNEVHGDLIPKWKSLTVYITENVNDKPWSWVELDEQRYGVTPSGEIIEGEYKFEFHLYQLST